MEDEFETQSWQDRCERYFTSISDTGKDRDQEKHLRNDSENSREKRESRFLDDNEKIWKNLSEVRQRFSEYWLVRRARKALSVLDVHGARFASITKGTAGFILWVAVLCISIVTFGVLLFFMMNEILKETSQYRIRNMSNKLDLSDVSLTVCNLNLIKKYKLANSDLKDLNNFLSGTNMKITMTERKTVKEVINSNSELNAILLKRNSGTLSDFVAKFENDVVVKELVASSDLPLLHRLSKYGKPDMLREASHISKAVVEEMGHVANETIVECWIGNTQCQKKGIQTKTDPVFGNCFSVSIHSNSGTIELILDALSEEYIYQLSPSIGFAVSLGDSSDTVQDEWMVISPGLHSTISINQLTTINRLESMCSPSSVSRKTCENRCLKRHIVKICNCSLYGEEQNQELCRMDQMSNYICVKSVQFLQLEGSLPCQCKERCSERKFDLRMTKIEWPSKQYMTQYGKDISSRRENVTNDIVRANMAKLTVHLIPLIHEEIEERQSFTVMDVLVNIGGLSALVAGISAVTVFEILFMVVRGSVRAVNYMRKRSDDVASPKRLSDSEITSITWAMYRQKRRLDEVHKLKDKQASNNGVNALGGNAHARIFKRNSYATPENMDANGDLVNKHAAGSNDNPARQNYLRRYDGKNPSYQSRNRESFTKERNNGDINNKYKNPGGDYKVNVIRPHRQLDYMYDNRHLPVYTGNVLHPNGFQYTDKNAVERPNNVFLYDGAAAYFNPASVSEPVYL